MTPLAHSLTKLLIVKSKKPDDEFWMINKSTLRDKLTDSHFFETSQIIPMLYELARIEERDRESLSEQFQIYGFLPAPKTWLEWYHDGIGERVALLLEEKSENHADVTLFFRQAAQPIGIIKPMTCDIETPGGNYAFPPRLMDYARKYDQDAGGLAMQLMSTAHAMLTLINSPKIIGRRQHMPHVGLERKLTRQFGVGRFPLQAWTELSLHVAKPPEIDDGEPHEAHLTGRRALHFCRKHLRIRMGRLEYVSAHWRGDAALGIKQKRYNVCP